MTHTLLLNTVLRPAILLALASLLLWQPAAHAAVEAFGFTLGQTTVSEALARGGTRSGTNKYTQGPMVEIPADRLGIRGGKSATLIFDPDNTLAVVMVTMDKFRFEEVLGHLKKKYALREESIPFVGNKYARLGAPDVTIELDAPHLSFEMTLFYQLDTFVSRYKRIRREEQQREQSREFQQF